MASTPRSLLIPILLALPGVASAQDPEITRAFDAHHLHLAAFDGDLRDPLLVQRPGLLHQWDWFAGGVLEYANAPLVRYQETSSGVFRTVILDNLVTLNVSAGVSFHERFRLDVAFPVYFASFDSQGEYQGFDFGDIRLTGMVPILMPNDDDEGFGLGVVGRFDIPSGAKRDFLGNRTVSGGLDVALTYAHRGGFTLSASGGLQFYPKINLDNLFGSDTFRGGIGVGYKVHKTTSLNLESVVEAALKKNEEPRTSSPVEMLLTLRHRRSGGGHLLAGGSIGLTEGAGAARFRLFLGGGFGKIKDPPIKDMDLDGILDAVDACPTEPETVNGYKDEDGCPDQLGSLDIRVLYQGKPVPGAEITLSKAESDDVERMLSELTPRHKDELMPGLEFFGRATLGGCLMGNGQTVIKEGENKLDIPLQATRGAKVVYELVDPKGNPVKDAVATWKTTTEGCVEPTGYVIGPTGRSEHPIGAGTHAVFIDAPGFRIHREDVTVAAGDVYVIRTTMKPTKVAVERKEIKILESVFFETASDVILSQSFDLLNEVADTIIGNNVGKVQVEGHTDDRGNDAYNMDLSQRRADSVRRYLIGRGVPADQLVAVGFGETQPIAPNTTTAGRAQNRRVVFRLLDQESQVIEVQQPGGGAP